MIRTSFALALSLAMLGMPPAAGAQTRADRQATAGLPKAAEKQVIRPVRFDTAMQRATGVLVLPLGTEADLARGTALDAPTHDAILRALKSADFKYGARATLSLRGVGSWDRILVIGLGEKPDGAAIQSAGAVAGRALINEKIAVTVLANGFNAEQAGEFATGIGLGQYRADLYGTVDRKGSAIEPVTIVTAAAGDAASRFSGRGSAIVNAMIWTRDIANEPANVVYPETFVDRARQAFAGMPGVTVEVLDPAAMERLGMGALLGVGRGSDRGPRMLVIRYRGAGTPSGGPVVLVGKGITFDSGGISIKPSANMGNMKFDMAGAAAVTGAVLALAGSRAPVDVVAISALAENMPDGGAIRPGDILRAMDGKTIEIGSTDAEGRLVLADALAWAQAKLNPAAVVDVATLTGAISVALGDKYAGLFSRHDALVAQIDAAAAGSGEAVWRMPLHPSYAGDLASPYADMKNGGGTGAGSGVGAHFIGAFLKPETPWAHLDIAGVGWANAAGDTAPAGATGWGVRLLERFVRDFKPITKPD